MKTTALLAFFCEKPKAKKSRKRGTTICRYGHTRKGTRGPRRKIGASKTGKEFCRFQNKRDVGRSRHRNAKRSPNPVKKEGRREKLKPRRNRGHILRKPTCGSDESRWGKQKRESTTQRGIREK